MDALTIISAIASIIGAYIAIKHASKAKGAAEEAKRVRKQLIDHRKASELSKIQASCKKALNSMMKYGPASTPSSLAGISTQNDSFDVQEFIILTKEHRAYFGDTRFNKADEFCRVLTSLLDDFAQASTPDDQRKYGKQLITHLSSINAYIKKLLDSKRETVH